MRSTANYEAYGKLRGPQCDKVTSHTASYEVHGELRGPWRAMRPTASYEADGVLGIPKVIKLRGLMQATRPTVWQSYEAHGRLRGSQCDKATRPEANNEVHSNLRGLQWDKATRSTGFYEVHKMTKLRSANGDPGSPQQATKSTKWQSYKVHGKPRDPWQPDLGLPDLRGYNSQIHRDQIDKPTVVGSTKTDSSTRPDTRWPDPQGQIHKAPVIRFTACYDVHRATQALVEVRRSCL